MHIIFVAYCWSWLEAIWYTYLYLFYNMLSTINYQTLFFLTSLFYCSSAQILAVLCLYDTFNFNFSLDQLCMCFLKNRNLSCPIRHSRIFMSCFHIHTHTHTSLKVSSPEEQIAKLFYFTFSLNIRILIRTNMIREKLGIIGKKYV